MLAKEPQGNSLEEDIKPQAELPPANNIYQTRTNLDNIPISFKSFDHEINNTTTLNGKRKTSGTLVNYMRNKKKKSFFKFLIHCGVILFIGLFSKYAFSEEVLTYHDDY